MNPQRENGLIPGCWKKIRVCGWGRGKLSRIRERDRLVLIIFFIVRPNGVFIFFMGKAVSTLTYLSSDLVPTNCNN